MRSVQESPYFVGNILEVNPRKICERMQVDGLLFFKLPIDRAKYVQWFNALFEVRAHPDSDDDGVTEVSEIARDTRHGAGAAFSNSALQLHVDGSAERVPPPVLSLLVVSQANTGGETLLSDGRDLIRWCQRNPHLKRLLDRTSRARFREAHYPIFDPLSDIQSMTFRFRQDAFLSSTENISDVEIRAIAAQLNESAISVRLNAGEGYLLHNHRWTHGRRAFAGSRVAWRLLGALRESDPCARLNDGFVL